MEQELTDFWQQFINPKHFFKDWSNEDLERWFGSGDLKSLNSLAEKMLDNDEWFEKAIFSALTKVIKTKH